MMPWVFDWLVPLAQVGLLAALQLRFPETVGGGAVFIMAATLCMYFARVRRISPELLGRLALAAVCLEALNAVAFLEQRGDFRRPLILAFYLGLAVVLFVLTYQASISPVRLRRGPASSRTAAAAQLVKSIAGMFFLLPGLALGTFAFFGGMAVCIGEKSWLVQQGWVTMSSLAVLWQVVGALVQRAFLPRITDEQVACVVRVRSPVQVANLERKVGGGLLLLFLLGVLGELGRGLWFFYVGSYALWTLTLVNGWKVWRHVLAEREVSVAPSAVPPAYNIVEDFRVFVYGVIAASVYVIGLTALLGLTSPRIHR